MSYRRFSPLILIRHPLLPAMLVYVLLLTADWTGALRLLMLEPVAMANSSVAQESEADLSREERLYRENLRYKERIAEQAALIDRYLQTYSQFKDYEDAFPVQPESLGEPIPAQIILRGDSSNWRHTIYINRGSNHGVQPGYAVSVGRILAGRVTVCGPNLSMVQLITDPAFAVPVNIIPGEATSPTGGIERTSRGVLRGNGGRRPRLPRLPLGDIALDSGVTAGMLVVTNDKAGTMPAGLLVGTVAEIHNRNTFLDVEVDSALDLELVDMVLVIPHQRPSLDEISRQLAAHPGRRGMERRDLDRVER